MRKPVWAVGWLLALAAGGGVGPATARGQAAGQASRSADPVTTLKVGTRVVEIAAVVKGKDGAPRGGMTRDDFVLKQDGKEEPIRYFSQGSELPLTLALLVDTSGSQRSFIGDEVRASDVFFETMLERREDRAMLVQFDTRVLQLRGMTNSASALHLSLLNLGSQPATAGGTLLNDAVVAVAKNALARETGRKAMVILSDGGDNGSRASVAQAVEQAQRGDVQIYAILYSAWQGFSGGPATAGRAGGADPGQGLLEKLAESTGGHVFTVSQSLSLREIYAEIAADLHLQYEVGYTPPADVQPDSYHRLELKARDRKLMVQARKGFFARP